MKAEITPISKAPAVPKSLLERARMVQRAQAILDYRAAKLAFEGDLSLFTAQAWKAIEPTTELIWNWHLDVMCAYLEAFRARKIKRLIFNVPPGTLKSILVSAVYPASVWAQDPGHRFVDFTNSQDLALRDSRRMRDIVRSEWYQGYWPTEFSRDQQGIASFANTAKGFRDALGFSANITGRRGNTLLIDDPHDAEKAFSDVIIQQGITTYDNAISTRLNDFERDGIVLVMQRLRTNDLSGHLLQKKKQKWVHVCIPMEYEGTPGYDPQKDLGTTEYHGRSIVDPRAERGELLFPERFSRATVETLKEDLGDYGTAGQLQQRPSPLAGGILKQHQWRVWGQVAWTKGRKPPFVKHVFCSLDTAYTERDLRDAAYTACTAWGVFWDEEKEREGLLLLRAWWERLDYPDLKERTVGMVSSLHMKEGDAYLVEKKASGQSLLQDLGKLHRRSGIQVRGYDPKPDGDKVARGYLAQPLLKAGFLWIPDKEWARDVTRIAGEFPAGAPPCADLFDTITQAALYLKRRHWLIHPDDAERDEPDEIIPSHDDWRTPGHERRIGYG